MVKENLRKYIRSSFLEKTKLILDDFEEVLPCPDLTAPQSAVLRKKVNANLFLYVQLYILPCKDYFFLCLGWSNCIFPEMNGIQSKSSSKFSDVIQKRYSPDFEKTSFGFSIETLNRETEGYISKGWKFPTVYSKPYYSKALPKIDNNLTEVVKLIEMIIVPYFEVLKHFKENKGFS